MIYDKENLDQCGKIILHREEASVLEAHDGFTTFKVCYSLFNFYTGWHLLPYYVLHKPVIIIQVYCVSICALLCLLIRIMIKLLNRFLSQLFTIQSSNTGVEITNNCNLLSKVCLRETENGCFSV
ncbi:hypothetical protein T4D_1005 [Trichinella pseudospiralis]|uniref:Uncharacterized protein n=1 Tax=Trichinella pseudospiralis TaxID=6337 RepID=A0A0V1FEV6_TRIPS|nr:hypothetical protein T4D_1005 [Trichinella pseudospiralis]